VFEVSLTLGRSQSFRAHCHDVRRGRHLVNASIEFVKWNIDRARNLPIGEFVGLAHVQYEQNSVVIEELDEIITREKSRRGVVAHGAKSRSRFNSNGTKYVSPGASRHHNASERSQPHEAIELLDGDAILLDVREESEWEDGHAPMASLIPLAQLPDHVEELPTIASSFARVVRADDRYAPRNFLQENVLRWRI